MTDTMTRPEFDLAVHQGTAGPVTDLAADTVVRWRESDPSWKAKHWAYTDPDEHCARRLRPINLSTRAKATD